MAAASLLVRLGVDLGNLKPGIDAATREFDKLKASVSQMGERMTSALPKTLTAEAKNIGGAVASLATSFGGLGTVIGALGLSELANDFFETTGALVDLNAQTDISIRDLQRFKFAAEQSGSSLDVVTAAVGQLQNRLGSMDKSATSALGQLGLGINDVLRLDPGQQFELIANRISQIPEPTKRAALAMDLFGRGGVALLPVLRNNLTEVADQATVLSDRTVTAADSFDDMFGRIKSFGKAAVFEGLFGPLVRWAEDGKTAVDDLGNSFDALRGKMDALPTPKPIAAQTNGLAPTQLMSVEEALRVSDQLTSKVEAQIRAAEAGAERARAALASLREELSGQGAIKAANDMVTALKGLPPVFNLTRAAQDRVNTVMNEALDVYRAMGKDAPKSIRAIAAATFDLSRLVTPIEEGIPRGFEQIGKQAELALPPVVALFTAINEGLPKIVTGIDNLNLDDVLPEIQRHLKETGDAAAEAAAKARKEWDDLARTVGDLGQLLGGEFGGILQNISQGWLDASAAVEAYTKATTAAGKASAIAQGAMAVWSATGQESRASSVLGGAAAGARIGTAILPGWGTAIGAGVGALTGFLRSADNGREVVERFANEVFGSFDALHERLNDLGEEGETLWVNLTQRVARGNVDQAKSAIEAIQSALEAHAVKAMETEAQIAAAQQKEADDIDAATAGVKKRISDLDNEYQSLFRSIQDEAPEEVMGIVEAATRARMAAIQEQSAAAKDEEAEIIRKIKDGLGELGSEAEQARDDMEEALARSPIRIPVELVLPDGVRIPSETPDLPPGTVSAKSAPAKAGDVFLDGRKVGVHVTEAQSKRLRQRTKVSAR